MIVLSLGIDVLFDLVQTGEALRPEELHLLYDFSEKPLFDQVVNNFLMLFLRVEPGENLHGVDDISLFFGSLPLIFLSSLKIEKTSLNDELLPPDSFVESGIVELDDGILKLDVLLRVFVKELHVCKEKFGIHVVFLVKVTSLWKIADDLSTCLNGGNVASTLWISRVLLIVLIVLEQIADVFAL